MRITVVTTSYPTHAEDPSGHFVQAEVAELAAQGHEVAVVTPDVGGAFGWPGASSRLRERPWRVLDAGGWSARAALQIARARPDRIVAHWCVPSAWPVALAAPRSTPLEVVSHGGDVRLLSRLPVSAARAIVRAIARRAASWRFVSRPLLEQLTEGLGEEDRAIVARIAVVAPGALGMPDIRDGARANRTAVGERRLYVCAGRLVPSKRVDKVIDYVASDIQHRERTLVVLGDGPERPHLETLARRWRIDARFLGTRPRRETLAWIGAADELVHASRAEGLSTVVREAEHLGVKVTLL